MKITATPENWEFEQAFRHSLLDSARSRLGSHLSDLRVVHHPQIFCDVLKGMDGLWYAQVNIRGQVLCELVDAFPSPELRAKVTLLVGPQ